MIAEESKHPSNSDQHQEDTQNDEIFPESQSTQAWQSSKCALSTSNGTTYQNPQKKKQEEQYNKNKIISYQMIPKQQLKPFNLFYLRGEVFIDLNFNEFSRISNLNYFKQVRSATYVKEYGFLYVDYLIDSKQYDDHQRVAKLLKNSNDEDIYDLGEKIEKHEIIQQKHSEVKSQIMKYTSINNITSQLIAAKRQEFMLLRKEVLSHLPKDKYFMFVDYNFDYFDMTFKMVGNGMNQSFLKLLGCDFKSMQDILMRKGILDFVESKSKWKLLKRIVDNLKLRGEDKFHYEDRIEMITLDDILIDANFSSDLYNCQANRIFENFFHPDYKDYLIDKGFLIFELHITDFHILKINSIRQKYIEEYGKTGNYENIQPQFDHLYKPHLLSNNNSNNEYEEKSYEMEIEQNQSFTDNEIQKKNSFQNVELTQNSQSTFIQELVTDIPYTIQSQYFLDKFYNQNKPIPKKQSELQDKFPTKTCKYRIINQQS
ncbi:hypothetical protein ABPG74_013851 [Tetrahymena malaccensis]